MHTTLSALLLLPVFAQAQAQDPLSKILNDHLYFGAPQFENAHDSADFAQFRRGLQMDDFAPLTETKPHQYRMVWEESQHGGLWTVTRGDGRELKGTPVAGLALLGLMGTHYRTADGRQGVILVEEIPCGLICRSVWYYEEE